MMTKEMQELRSNHTSMLVNLTKAYEDNDAALQASILNQLSENEKEYAKQAQLAVFAECKASENPMYEFLCRRTYDTISHTIKTTETGVPVSAESSTKNKDLDLEKFTKYMEMSALWVYKVEKLNQMLCLDAAASLGYSKDDLAKLKLSYALSKEAKGEKLCGVSNTALTKTLQVIVDAILYEDNGNGSNKYKVCSPDAAYLRKTYTRRAASGVVKVAKTNFVIRIITDVLHKLAINGHYSVDGYKVVKENDAKKDAKKKAKKSSDKADNAGAETPIVVDMPATAETATESAE